MREFACADHPSADVVRAVALGRYSPAKGLDTVIRAVAQVEGVRASRCTARRSRRSSSEHRAELERLVGRAPGAGRARPGAAAGRSCPRSSPAPTSSSTTCGRARSDKVVYEAAASCLPVIASNPVFDEFLDPFPREDADELAKRLARVCGAAGRASGR